MAKRGWVALAAIGMVRIAAAQDDEPDLSFLEYLGSWQAGDDEWLFVADLDDEQVRDEDRRARDRRGDADDDANDGADDDANKIADRDAGATDVD
jgi:hypothetical protein